MDPYQAEPVIDMLYPPLWHWFDKSYFKCLLDIFMAYKYLVPREL